MINEAKADDVGAMARVHAACFDKAWSADAIGRMLANPAALALIVRSPAVRGFVMAWVAAGDAEVLTLAVTPAHQRKGIGEILMRALADVARARGAAGVHLDVAGTNVAARGLYGKLGYQDVGRRSAYYASESGPVDALVLRLALHPKLA